jgi:transcriptional regulator with XRE-family HTH domain
MEYLRKIRKNENYSILKMAILLNVSRRTYCNYENGKTEPSIKTLIKISQILDVSIDELVGNKIVKNKVLLSKSDLKNLANMISTLGEIVKRDED